MNRRKVLSAAREYVEVHCALRHEKMKREEGSRVLEEEYRHGNFHEHKARVVRELKARRARAREALVRAVVGEG